ncbi:hypothetical protein MFRU_023g00830 [Monilinia fructicola]|nr:hypothetical protein MFRU_023g00830 [Monilinia fructicola]
MSNIFIKTPANAMSDVSNYGLAWLATTIPLLFISVILISSRVAWKDEVLKKTDVGVLIALGFAIAQEIAVCVGILIWGLGYDVAFLDPEKGPKATMCFYISKIFYQTTIATNKISLIFFYLDFLSNSKFRIMHHITAISILLSLVSFETATIFQCTPISYFWYRAIEQGHCINTRVLSITHASTNIFFNLLLFILNIPILRSFNLCTSQKHALICAYFLGCLILTTSILNLSYLIPRNPSHNQSQQPAVLLFTHSLESILGLILLSLLTLHAPISHLFASLTHHFPSTPAIPFLPNTTPILNLFTRLHTRILTRTPHAPLTRFPPTSPWKTLKSLNSTSSFRSFRSRSSRYSRSPANLDAHRSVDDEMMVYVTILGDLHPTIPVQSTSRESCGCA